MICLNDHYLDDALTVSESNYLLSFRLNAALRLRLYEDDGLCYAILFVSDTPILKELFIEDPYDYVTALSKNPGFQAFLIEYADALSV